MDPATRRPVTVRAVLLGLLATTVLCALTPYNDYKIAATYVAGNHLPLGSFLVLSTLVLGVNVLLRRRWPRWALQPGELLTVWAMTAASSGLPSSALFRYLPPHIIAGWRYATPENGWGERVLAHLPAALQIRDPAAVRYFFEGLHGRAALPWHLWWRPLLVYSVFCVALLACFVCLSVLLRRQWVDHERFTFPIAQLPVEMAADPGPGQVLPTFFREPSLWAAVAVQTVIHTLNGLHRFFPSLPEVSLYGNQILGFADRGWRTLNGTWLWVYPLVIGFSYLLTNEVLLSLWLFYLLYKLQLVVADGLGVTPARVGAGYGAEAFASQQAAGAAVALVLWMLWSGRQHFAAVLRRALGGPATAGEAHEALSPRLAVWGLLGSLAVMLGWLVYFGGDVGLPVGVLAFAAASSITLTWLVAQAGLLFVQPVWAGREVLVRLFGSGSFSPRGILVNSQIEHLVGLDLREFLLPHLLNIQKAADPLGVSRRGLLGATVLALAVGYLVSAWATIDLPYRYGAEVGLNNIWTYNMSPQLPLKFLESLLTAPQQPQASAWYQVAGGLLGMWAVLLLRTRVAWFRLHPAGFIIASGYPLRCFWFSFLLGWIVKNAILRSGGLRLYRRARPFFLGLIVGDCLNGALWAVISALGRIRYAVLPG
ncbi:MAG: hypothetical protein IT204_11975 [Fimbriimonadaceae bacterium]|nr:hypothetical protein [Fimbriimonadaceae bacterium]